MLASAGDDGNTLLWIPSESHTHTQAFGEDTSRDKESWRIKHMCRSSGSEIYDLAWSPDGVFFITGSMDNIARIYNAQSGTPAFSNYWPIRYTNTVQARSCGKLQSIITMYKA